MYDNVGELVYQASGSGRGQALVQYAVPWTPSEFVGRASEVRHPYEAPAAVPDRTALAAFSILTNGPFGTARRRREELARWRRRADELDQMERDLCNAAPPCVRACWSGSPDGAPNPTEPWAGKRTELFREMAVEAGVPSVDMLVEFLRGGAPPFGVLPPTGLFDSRPHTATKTLTEVLQTSKWSKPVLRSTVRPNPEPRIDREVAERTDEEVQEGKAAGPFTEVEVDAILGPWWAPCRRVGILQGDSIRPIDDFSEFLHNASSDTDEYVDLSGVDGVVALMKLLGEAVQDDEVTITLEDGQVMRGRLHPGFKDLKARMPVGRALDLKRAYKQVPTAPSMRRLVVVALWHPGLQKVVYYILYVLPFGARNSVFIFGGLARALEMIMAWCFQLILTQYVDDFPQLEPAASAESATVFEEVLGLLGWQVKKNDGEIPQFCLDFTALGVQFDLRSATQGKMHIMNKLGRSERVAEVVQQVRSGSGPRRPLLETLRGLVGFARGQCFGRCGAFALHRLSRLLAAPTLQLSADDVEALEFWPAFLRSAPPRELRLGDARHPVLIWTDGAEEPSGVGVGAVLLDQETGAREAWGGCVEPVVVNGWKTADGTEKVIHQAEVLPCVLAVTAWRQHLHQRRALIFVDNDGARGALVKGTSASGASAALIHAFWLEIGACAACVWIDRVASASNPADGPSRGDFEWCHANGFKRIGVPGMTLR